MKKGVKIFLIVLTVFVLLRIALEPFAKYYVNRTLDNMEGYTGQVEDIDIQLWHGSYSALGLTLDQTNDGIETPFVNIDSLDLSVDWQALFNGKIAGEVRMVKPTLNFIIEQSGDEEQTGEDGNWVETIQELMPLTINRFIIENGTINYRDPSVKPKVDVAIEQLNLVAQNLSNVQDSLKELPATLSATATSIGGGKMNLDMKMDILQEIPQLDAQFKFMNIDLTAINDMLVAYGNFDVRDGNFSLVSEIKVDQGNINGYLKPFFENLDVFSKEQDLVEEKGFFRKVWEGLVGAGAEILEYQPEERVATEIPLSGKVTSPDTNIPVTIFNIFKNAFIDAIEKKFDQAVKKPD